MQCTCAHVLSGITRGLSPTAVSVGCAGEVEEESLRRAAASGIPPIPSRLSWVCPHHRLPFWVLLIPPSSSPSPSASAAGSMLRTAGSPKADLPTETAEQRPLLIYLIIHLSHVFHHEPPTPPRPRSPFSRLLNCYCWFRHALRLPPHAIKRSPIVSHTCIGCTHRASSNIGVVSPAAAAAAAFPFPS